MLSHLDVADRWALAFILAGIAIILTAVALALRDREPEDQPTVVLPRLERSDEMDAIDTDLLTFGAALRAADEPTIELPVDPVLAAVRRRLTAHTAAGLPVAVRLRPPVLLRPWPGLHEPITSMLTEMP